MKIVGPKILVAGLVLLIGLLIAANIYIFTYSTRLKKSVNKQVDMVSSLTAPIIKNPDIITSSDVPGYSIDINILIINQELVMQLTK